MRNNIIIFLLLLIISSLEARYKVHKTKQIEGQKYYLEHCSSCHGNGNRGGNLYSIYEWKGIFDNQGKELIALHDGEDNVTTLIQYIKSDDFNMQSKQMLKFIQEFAYDSETIPTCN